MNKRARGRFLGILIAPILFGTAAAADSADTTLPAGAKAVWDMNKAFRETTPTRERICVNGLWRWQPADRKADTVPAANWGYFKVPGSWPGITDYMQEDTQTIYPHPSWKDQKLPTVTAAWYQREITVPREWSGRRIALELQYLNSFATVYLDAKKVGEIHFPAGEIDLTPVCSPGSQHVLSLLVVAMPLSAVQISFSDTNAAKEAQGNVQRRGLCGDAFLVSEPKNERISHVRVDTSVLDGEITFVAELKELKPAASYTLRAEIQDKGRKAAEFTSKPLKATDLVAGRTSFSAKWKPDKLWDISTPENQYEATLTLSDTSGKALDTSHPERFGFREFEIKGRDFSLNGTRIHLCAVPFDNAEVSAAAATYDGAKETLLRMKSFGINFVYTHNYGCEPGTNLGFAEILKAADDVGMLVALSQPHFGQYKWQSPDADDSNGYARDAAFYTRVAGSHPSVIMYATSHNATGYVEGNNPDMIDGIQDPRPDWARNSVKAPLRAEAIIKRLDPSRIVYHHSSGNLGAIYSLNFYTNFTPIQEMDDWFGHWATKGVMPLFTCEYGVPFTWDWTMYRGWYRGGREFGSAAVPWEYCMAEWNSQFNGDKAFQISDAEKVDLRWEAKKFRAGGGWHRWDFPHQVGAVEFEEQFPIIARYTEANWRAFRTWGVSAISPWQYSDYWRLRSSADRKRKNFPVDWEHLQRPGFSPDYSERPFHNFVTAYGREDWEPNEAGRALLRNNKPLLAYIAGKPAAFTSKDHIFTPGETIEKQLIIINDSRRTIQADCEWKLGLPGASSARGNKKVEVATGDQARIPLRFDLPATLKPGPYAINATVRFSTGETRKALFSIDVLPSPAASKMTAKLAIFDPKGETTKLLETIGASGRAVKASDDLAGFDVLVIGKGALTVASPGPDVSRVREGLKVIIFEQTGEVLERRFGFRIAEYGLRQVWPRVPDHPLLKGLDVANLHDWRGEATILPPRLKYIIGEPYRQTTPVVKWCDLYVPRVWRCGCRGNVASALIEKPAKGDFLPILDGGYSLQYTPLLEHRDGKGLVLFCQVDVTARTENDPAAERLARNVIEYVSTWKPAPSRQVLYVGEPAGQRHLEHAGITAAMYDGGKISSDQVLVVGPGGGRVLIENKGALGGFMKGGGHVLALGLDEAEANAFLPSPVSMKRAEHIATFFEPPSRTSAFVGIGPADVHNRGPRELPLLTTGAQPLGDGVLAQATKGNVVFFQLPPYNVTRAEGAVPSFVVDDDDAADGKKSALLTLGTATESGMQFGQKVKGGEVGKIYTFRVMVKPIGMAVPVHLEIERPARPWDRAVKGETTVVPADEWTELHVPFKVDKPFPEGWFAYIAGGSDGARVRVDRFRITEGDHASVKSAASEINFTNGSFEEGTQPWSFTFEEQYNLRRTYRRSSYTLTRLMANMGVTPFTPMLERIHTGVSDAKPEKRWLDAYYVDQPEEWDDPYRFFNW